MLRAGECPNDSMMRLRVWFATANDRVPKQRHRAVTGNDHLCYSLCHPSIILVACLTADLSLSELLLTTRDI